jgi:predicted ATPase
MRYRLLETLRDYGNEQLTSEERIDLARRHACCFLALAEQAEPELVRAAQGAWRGSRGTTVVSLTRGR